MNKIVVLGGTGVLGSAVVNKLQEQGIDYLIASRTRKKDETALSVPWQRIDLSTGEGLAAALNGVDTVLHLASNPGTIDKQPFEIVAIQNLLNAIQQTDVKHLIYISIVGVDRIPFSYYQAKLAVEGHIQRSRVPYTILRATQFHNFIDMILGKLFSLPIALVPKRLKAQPISVETVADELLLLAEAGPQRALFNLGGREVLDLGTMAEAWQSYQPRTRPVLNIPIVGSLMRSFTRGDNTSPEIAPTSQTWDEYLATTYQNPANPFVMTVTK